MLPAETQKLILETHASVKVVQDQNQRLERAILGNGRPGLVDRVSLLEERQSSCPARENVTFAVRNGKAILWVAVASVLVGALACVAMLAG